MFHTCYIGELTFFLTAATQMIYTDRNIVDLNQRRKWAREQTLERLFKEYVPLLRTFLMKRLGHVSDMEDLIQDVFSRLLLLKDVDKRFSENYPNNKSYIFTAANNMIVDLERRKAVRRNYQEQHLDDNADKFNEVGPEEHVIADQQVVIIKDIVMNLKPQWRRAFVMSRFHYMSYQEISEEMNISIKQVEYYITSALVRIRDATADQCIDGDSERESR